MPNKPLVYQRLATGDEFSALMAAVSLTYNSHPWRGHPSESVGVAGVDWSDGVMTIRLRYGSPRMRAMENGRLSSSHQAYPVTDYNLFDFGEPVAD